MGMMLPKLKRKRLTGRKIADLNKQVHERDDDICIIPGCGRYVSSGEKFHHVILKSQGGNDSLNNGVTLCYQHHIEAHGKNGKSILQYCLSYIKKLYGGEIIEE
jgi:hypothetical protein